MAADTGVEVIGLREQAAALGRASVGLRNPRAFLERGEQEFYAIEVRQFATQGQGKWPQLSPEYAARKEATHPGQPIMVRDGGLRESLTGQGGEYQVRRLIGDTLEIGTNRPGASAHQDSKRSWLPTRKVIDLTPAEIGRWRDLYAIHVNEVVHEAGLA